MRIAIRPPLSPILDLNRSEPVSTSALRVCGIHLGTQYTFVPGTLSIILTCPFSARWSYDSASSRRRLGKEGDPKGRPPNGWI